MVNNIKEKIIESGYTQNHIAKQIGVHFSEISQWVAGRRKLKLSWSPPISEIKDENHYQRLLGDCMDEINKLYPKRRWF